MAIGMERIVALPVGERVNFQLFQQVAQGASVRVGGRIAPSPQEPNCFVLTATDGGAIALAAEHELPQSGGLVEAVGTKASDVVLATAGIFPLPGGEVGADLWDGADAAAPGVLPAAGL